MRFAGICFLSAVAAAGAIPRTGAAGSGTRKVATLTGWQRRLHAGSETRTFQASTLTEPGSDSGRHTGSWSKVAVANDGEADVKAQLADTRDQRSQQQQQRGDRHKRSRTTEGGILRAPRNRQATTSPAAHSSRNDETEEKKRKEKKKSNPKSSHEEGRTDRENGAEEKVADSGHVTNSAEVPQTNSAPKERSTEPEYQRKEEVSSQNAGTHLNSPAATNVLQDAKALADVPMTREQRLELLLDYYPILPRNAIQDNRRKSSLGSRNQERQKTTSDTRRKPRGRPFMATAELLQTARRSTRLPRCARSERTTKSKSLRHLAVAGVLLTCLAIFAALHGYEDRGRLRVNTAEHSPFFPGLQAWATLRRAALGVEPDMFRLRDL